MSEPEIQSPEMQSVVVEEAGFGPFAQRISVGGKFTISADEPEALGGTHTGPTPYDLLLAALGACTSMTMRMYATRKGIPLKHARVALSHDKIHAEDCAECETKEGQIDRIERTITLEGDLTAAQRDSLLAIAEKCPVHRTLMSKISIVTRLAD